MALTYTLPSEHRLKSRKVIGELFVEGQSCFQHPLKAVYRLEGAASNPQRSIGVSVSKRHFRKAVDRNRIKRLLREAYRLEQHAYPSQAAPLRCMIIYIGKAQPKLDQLRHAMRLLLTHLYDQSMSNER